MKHKAEIIKRNGAGKCRIQRDEAESPGMVPGAYRSSLMKK